MTSKFKFSRGFPLPYGASMHPKGINFSLFSRHATAVSLCLFDENGPLEEIPLDASIHKSGDVWHIFIFDLAAETLYGYRLDGEYDPLHGKLFDNRLIVLDPYARSVASSNAYGIKQTKRRINLAQTAPLKPFDWQQDKHPNHALNELIIYEMHVRSFTIDPSSDVQHRGTFLGIIEKIPYLKLLGINAIELMPIHEFDERENQLRNPKTAAPLYQYWGYSSINFFSLMRRYAIKDPIEEFKTLVKALHANDIEVIVDVVFNHTAEGNDEGATLSFRGIENPVYYLLGPNGEYYNFSGCGNTFNCNHPVVREMIRDSLRFFVTEYHVDGFRFDLASILTRGHDGIVLERPPLIEALKEDPILARTKLIAEAWDAAGLYQVGSFPGMGRFAEWNGRYRDEVRRFLKGSDGEIGHFATRLAGSSDLYGKYKPQNSVNFITAHDGFTLRDLVSYNEKHNFENGEENRDGSSDNCSWNCGVEGQTTDATIIALRERQMRNHMVALMVSQGIPMILSGDEYGHTKLGNNNTWGHDSRLNWFQWDTLQQNQPLFNFFCRIIDFRKKHSVFQHTHFLKEKDIHWYGKEGGHPDWSPKSRFVAFALFHYESRYVIYIAFNAYATEIKIKLPPTPAQAPWLKLIDTAEQSPHDIVDEENAKPVESTITLPGHSSLVLKRKLTELGR